MDKRYQVFVSSTYEDLKDERRKVIQALLEFDCIPAGMEFIPAADASQWEVIKRVIEECDYYMVIVAGRYGSLTPEGISYTQKEYEYALEKGIPVVAFLRDDPESIPAKMTERDDDRRRLLNEFRTLCQKKMCRTWGTPEELAGAALASLNHLRKTNPAIGWVRADQVPDESAAKEILRLRGRVEEMEAERDRLRTTPPVGTENLAQGDDPIEIHFEIRTHHYRAGFRTHNCTATMTWSEAFSTLSPMMIREASDSRLQEAFAVHLLERARGSIAKDLTERETIQRLTVAFNDFNTVIIQMRALGMITPSVKQRSLKDTSTYWKLTPYGDSLMTMLRSVKRVNKD